MIHVFENSARRHMGNTLSSLVTSALMIHGAVVMLQSTRQNLAHIGVAFQGEPGDRRTHRDLREVGLAFQIPPPMCARF